MTKRTSTLHEDLRTFMIMVHWILQNRMGNFSDKLVEKIKMHILYSFWDNGEKYGSARHATYDNILQHRKDVICILQN
jgi:hypothetical protein